MTTLDSSTNVQSQARTASRLAFLSRLRVQSLAIPALMIVTAAVVFGLQSYNIGFWSPGHGWTSVHGLALFTHATPETGLVAYSQAFRLPDGSIAYHYFDRYPFFTSAAGNLLLRITDDLPTEIMIFRHVMNVIFLLTMFVSYRIIRLFIENRYLAFAVTVFAFSSYNVMHYKDMIHFDQPALLMMMVLLYAIARYKLNEWRVWAVFAVAIAAVSIGRGYSSFFVLGMWVLLESIRLFVSAWRDKTLVSFAFVMKLVRQPAVWITVAAVLWAGSLLSYNIYMEARTRNISITQTSVIDSALRRLPFVGNAVAGDKQLHTSDKGLQAWREFGAVQTERVVRWVLPVQLGGEMYWRFVPLEDDLEVNWWRLSAGIAMFGVVIAFIVRTRPPLRIPAAALAFGGMLWLYVMINLSTKHDYVTMYSLGFSLVVYMALLRWAGRFPIVVGALVIASLGAFTSSAVMVRDNMTEEIKLAQHFTYDFNRIRPTINGTDNTIFLDYDYYKPSCIIDDDLCFAPGYYLDDNFLSEHPENANYVLSPRAFYSDDRFVTPGQSIELVLRPTTPQNRLAYLLDLNMAETRQMPDALDPLARYGGSFGLQSWALNGDVNLSACESVLIESWWFADQKPDTNYNMQIAMVDTNGIEVTDANAPLGRTPTAIWELERFTGDVRPITVPCDTPPGEYPLIMGVYNPKTLQPLPVYAADGNPIGNQLYLTTLFVQ